MPIRSSGLTTFLTTCLVLNAASCADPRGKLNEYQGRVTDANSDRADAPIQVEIPDITGDFVFAISASAFPSGLFKFRAAVELIDRMTAEPKLSFTLYALDATTNEEVGDPVHHDPDPTLVSPSTGEWTAHIVAMVPGPANPISGTPVTVDVNLYGVIPTEDHFCGTADGAVTSPFTLDLAGSNFGAVRIPAGGSPGDVVPTGVCLSDSGDLDAGVSDAGSPDAN